MFLNFLNYRLLLIDKQIIFANRMRFYTDGTWNPVEKMAEAVKYYSPRKLQIFKLFFYLSY